MKLHIIGRGVVGSATGSLFSRFGYQVLYTDKGDDHAAVRAAIHFVCTPEGVAPDVVRELMHGIPWVDVPNEGVVIRSSVPPGTTAGLARELGFPFQHNPEFLREATAEADMLESQYIVIGGPVSSRWSLHSLYQSCGKEILWASSTETELLKLVNNAWLSTQVSFWNEVKSIADNLDVNSHHMARLMVKNDSRLSPYGALRHGQAYGGHCLPKDINQLLAVCERLGLSGDLLTAVKTVNTLTKADQP